jgi:hypothetical protein
MQDPRILCLIQNISNTVAAIHPVYHGEDIAYRAYRTPMSNLTRPSTRHRLTKRHCGVRSGTTLKHMTRTLRCPTKTKTTRMPMMKRVNPARVARVLPASLAKREANLAKKTSRLCSVVCVKMRRAHQTVGTEGKSNTW